VTASKKVKIYLEIGRQRTFAAAVDWPGWCRSGKDESGAVAALVQAGPRYGRAVRSAHLEFAPPTEPEALSITYRLPGNATTDYGAPDRPLPGDATSVPEQEVRRLQAILRACWRAFDGATQAAAGRPLRKGPRGGGRDLAAIERHVLEAEAAYLARLGRRYEIGSGDPASELRAIRRVILVALAEAALVGTPPPGPRGGERWTARRFARRVAWHVLDHAWEIEDRME